MEALGRFFPRDRPKNRDKHRQSGEVWKRRKIHGAEVA
jgi:hypothetical protein